MAYKLTGRVLIVGETYEGAKRPGAIFKKRDLVLTAMRFDPNTGIPSEDPDNTPKFTFVGESIHDLDSLKKGDRVTVHFNVKGRSFIKNTEGDTDYFTSLNPVRIEKPETATATAKLPTEPAKNAPEGEKNDVLPF